MIPFFQTHPVARYPRLRSSPLLRRAGWLDSATEEAFGTGLIRPKEHSKAIVFAKPGTPEHPSHMSKNHLAVILCGIIFLLSAGVSSAGDSAVEGKDHIDAKSFRCIREMTHVRQFYVDNVLGNLDATLAVANSATGGMYPAGSVIQFVPTEAMVKRDKGFNSETHDWEFFELDVSKDGTEIRKRGFADVVNRFGGNCFGCHIQARPQWDLVCEMGHGCAPIPVTRAMSGALQRTDPRCENQPVSPEDAEALKQLNELAKPRPGSSSK